MLLLLLSPLNINMPIFLQKEVIFKAFTFTFQEKQLQK